MSILCKNAHLKERFLDNHNIILLSASNAASAIKQYFELVKSRLKGAEICRSDNQSTMVEIGFYRDHLVTHFISVKQNLVLDTLSKMSFCKECMQMAQRHFLLGDKQKAWTDFPFIFFDDQGRLI